MSTPLPQFTRLNLDWNAEPNAPEPCIAFEGRGLALRFDLNSYAYEAGEGEQGILTFDEVSLWRMGGTNDEGWYRGQCRYSRVAPEWGEFYEISGKDDCARSPDDWHEMTAEGERHFLFYLKDETFECFASRWSFRRELPQFRAVI